MKLNKNSWHYKLWSSSYERGEAPYNTDLCRYCHKVFWAVVLRAVLFGMLGVCVVGGVYMLVYQGMYLHPGPFFAVVGVIAAVLTVIVLYVRWLNGRRSYREPTTLVGKYARAAKQGVCPLVEFTGED